MLTSTRDLTRFASALVIGALALLAGWSAALLIGLTSAPDQASVAVFWVTTGATAVTLWRTDLSLLPFLRRRLATVPARSRERSSR